MNNRLKQFLAAENITQAQFADTINVVRASVSHILAGRNKPSFDFISAMMQKYPTLNIEWLMFGKGKMYKDSPAADPVQLFPEESPLPPPSESASEPVQELREQIADEFAAQHPEARDTRPPRIDTKAINNNIQNIVNQRKVIKVILMFDDGSYQEL